MFAVLLRKGWFKLLQEDASGCFGLRWSRHRSGYARGTLRLADIQYHSIPYSGTYGCWFTATVFECELNQRTRPGTALSALAVRSSPVLLHLAGRTRAAINRVALDAYAGWFLDLLLKLAQVLRGMRPMAMIRI
jgi:hypothetical protein